jgi:hypothetical protein
MRYEMKRVEPLRAANLAALVYGIVTAAFAVIFFPFVMLFALLAPSGDGNRAAAFLVPFMLILYPILGVVLGWISGLISSVVYNFVVRFAGGLLVELTERPASPGAMATGGTSGITT